MQKNKGYLLPSGDAYTEDMACTLVFYPDEPEYRRALLGSIAYLANWIAWEKEPDHKGIDAALSWKIALECTVECWNMACLESLIDDVAAIRDLLETRENCCSDITTYGDTTIYNTTIIVDDGDPPDYYGETAVTDWDDWKEYLCYNANLWVDELKAQAESLELVLDVGGLSVGLVGFAIAAVALFVVGGFVSLPVVIAITAGIIAGYSSNMFSAAADDIEDARDVIICSIMKGYSVSDAIEAAVGSTVWDIFFSHIDYDSAVAILYEGGDGETYLEAEQDDSCNCAPGVGYYYYYNNSEAQDWMGIESNSFVFDGAYGIDNYCMRVILDGTEHLVMSDSSIREEFGLTATAGKVQTLHQVRFWYKFTGANGGNARLYVNHDGGQSTWSYGHPYVWTEVVQTFDPPLVSTLPHAQFVKINTTSQPGVFCVDQIVIDLDMDDD